MKPLPIHKRQRRTKRRIHAASVIFGSFISAFAIIFVQGVYWAFQPAEQPQVIIEVSDLKSHVEIPEVIRVASRIAPNTYFLGDDGPTGFEYQLAEQFSKSLGSQLVIDASASNEEIYSKVEKNLVSFASAALKENDFNRHKFIFSESYYQTQPIVVYKVGSQRPRSLKDLSNKNIVVLAKSQFTDLLRNLQFEDPSIRWREINHSNYSNLLELVANGEADLTIIDDHEFYLRIGQFPQLKRAIDFGDRSALRWIFPYTESGKYLRDKANAFLADMEQKKVISNLVDQHFGYSSVASQVSSNEFNKDIRTKLSKYLPMIQETADQFDLDWRFLAAMSYQESGWNPKAVSPTGVRGMMMLTQRTAKEMGVKNRIDAQQSLYGGAKYYKHLYNRMRKLVEEPDLTWFTLAAYNVGYGHMLDARKLARMKGLNPDRWYDIRQVLPLLSQPEWYRKTYYGYARGSEPVDYVNQIKNYYSVLAWRDIEQDIPLYSDDIFNIVSADQLIEDESTLTKNSMPPATAIKQSPALTESVSL